MDKNFLFTLYKELIVTGYNISLKECNGGYPDINNCSWYHGNWMLLRYLGLVSNPFWHENFYNDALINMDCLNSKLLVAGTADFSMPLLCSLSGCMDITIYDICNTPLCICNIVSEKLKVSWRTKKQDICSKSNDKFDLVVNDAFISRFIDKSKPLRGIANTLNNDGYYITSLKKKSNTLDSELETLKNIFVKRAVERYDTCKELFPNVHIRDIAKMYVKNMKSYPVKDEKEIIDLFNDSGFKVIHIEQSVVEGEYEPSEYYRIIAQKS